MAEIYYSCWNRINGKHDPPKKYKMSRDIELCEECGRWTHVIISERKSYYFHKFRMFLLPFKIVWFLFYMIGQIFLCPYRIYTYKKTKKP